ncbi:hypothetical protein Tco_0105952 [Tanacetum coccineum]
MEMLAVKSHGDKLFGLSPNGTLSSFDIHSSEVCWSIPTDIALDLDFSYKSSDCSYFVDSSRVFMHTKETKPREWKSMVCLDDDYEKPQYLMNDQFEKESMPIYDTDIEDVIKEETRFVRKGGFGGKKTTLKTL